jgi:hypothetical protein
VPTITFRNVVKRQVEDERPVFFGWPVSDADITYTVSIDGGNVFENGQGIISENTDGNDPEYSIPYLIAERPTGAGSVVYELTDGTYSGRLNVNVLSVAEGTTVTVPCPPPVVSSVATTELLYDVGEVVYLRESAALGFLEAVRISGAMRQNGRWLYSVTARPAGPTAVAHHGDRITAVHGMILYFTESEFVTHCDALSLAEANAQRQLQQLQAQRTSLCVESTES